MPKVKEQSLHINSIPIGLKNQLKKLAKANARSLEKQVVHVLKEYIEQKKG